VFKAPILFVINASVIFSSGNPMAITGQTRS